MKVLFQLEPGMWHGSATETLWAEPTGPGQYRLENTPFYAFGISFQNVVLARAAGKEQIVIEVIQRGGHSTYRIIPKDGNQSEIAKYCDAIQRLGCTYEEGFKGLLAVDVPPAVNVFDVYAALQAGEDAGVWSFEEGHCGHSVA